MTQSNALIDLERKFWQSLVDQDADTAVKLLVEPALMVSTHGTMRFDHDGYRQMAEQGPVVLTSFELEDVEVTFPNDTTAIVTYPVKQVMAPRGKTDGEAQEMNDTSTWIKTDEGWRCAIHTETPAEPEAPPIRKGIGR
jgi:ketosteroid isomerase-like protein